ncbi:MAG: hypothetical protein Q8N26_34765 [Myxococcales bacterium]|nr:hypothetical protein [Myxococcales bacterium]
MSTHIRRNAAAPQKKTIQQKAAAAAGVVSELLAIARADSLCSKCSLRNSLNFRMDSLSAGT